MERTDSQISELREDMERLELGTTDVIPASPSEGSIDNLIDDGDYSYSHAAYTTAGVTPGAAGDDNNRAFNWYRIERATALMVEDNAHALKGPAHSLFGAETADTPRWDKANGWAELGETGAIAWDICCPLPHNFIISGWRYNLQMICRLRTSTALPAPIQFAWAFHDNTNTAPAPRVIQGAPLTLSGGVFGPPGATTRNYKLIIDTDQGGQVESNVLTINNAPAALSAANGVNLSWPVIPGFTRVTIYASVAGATFIAGFVGNGAGAFTDTGQNFGAVGGGFPSVADTVAKAYAVARRNFEPSTEWLMATFTIFVPQTYNASLTTGRQWLRGSVLGLMGDPHQLQIDRIGVSTGTGIWSPSTHDKNVQSLPSTSITSSQQQPPFSGGPPPGDGEGRIACSTFDTLIDVCDEDGSNARKIELGAIDEDAVAAGTYLLNRHGYPTRVRRSRIGWSNLILSIQTANGAGRRCSPSDLWLVAGGPASGTPAQRLTEGTEVLTRKNGSVQSSEIVRYSPTVRGEEVRILETEGTHDDERVYWAGDAAAHNAKPESPNIF